MAAKGTVLQLTQNGLLEYECATLSRKISVDRAYAKPGFIDAVNDQKLVCNSDYANEFFLYFYLRVCEYSSVIGEYSKVKSDFFPWSAEWHVFWLARRKSGIRCGLGENVVAALLNVLFVPILMLLSFASVLFLVPYVWLRMGRLIGAEDVARLSKLYLVRSKASCAKFDRLRKGNNEDSLVVIDDVFGVGGEGVSVYSPLKWLSCPKVIFFALVKSVRDLSDIVSDVRGVLGAKALFLVFFTYWLRVSHKALYEACLSRVLDVCSKDVVVYSGNKEDRFAVLETRLCESRCLDLVCIPHGLEYGFNFPMGLCGAEFYCNSSVAAEWLNKLYGVDKFVFSEAVAKKMLGVGQDNESLVDRICYFSEPRDVDVNFLIIDALCRAGVDFYVKFHPLDDRAEFFQRFPQLKVIESLDEALKSSICLARKSTVLLEALYRGSKPIAVLVSEKDRTFFEKVFPALNDSRIEKAATVDALLDKLK